MGDRSAEGSDDRSCDVRSEGSTSDGVTKEPSWAMATAKWPLAMVLFALP